MGKALPPANLAPPVVLEQRADDGALLNRTELGDGVPHGQMTAFGADEKPTMQAGYRAGVLHGTCRLWDDAATNRSIAGGSPLEDLYRSAYSYTVAADLYRKAGNTA